LSDECVDLPAGQIEVVRSEDGRPIQTRITRLEGIASEEEVWSSAVTQDEPPESPQSREDGA